MPMIQEAVKVQDVQLAKGGAADTGVSADNFARQTKVGNGLNSLDNNTYITFPLPIFRQGKIVGGGGQLAAAGSDSSGSVLSGLSSTTLGGSVSSGIVVVGPGGVNDSSGKFPPITTLPVLPIVPRH